MGFIEEYQGQHVDFKVPKAAFGLSVQQMAALGITAESVVQRPEPIPVLSFSLVYASASELERRWLTVSVVFFFSCRRP
jgi:hypothetical protein